MKLSLPVFLLSGLLVHSLHGIEAPPDNSPPPVEVQPKAELPVPQKEDAPYLGLVSSAVPEMLADHLGLKQGEGVMINGIMPDGPAARAGLAKNDIIRMLGGEPIGSPDELRAKVAGMKVGQAVRLDVIHLGKLVAVDVTLGSRPSGLAGPAPKVLDNLDLEGIPQELAERVRRMIEGNLGELNLEFEKGIDEAMPQMEDALRQMRERLGKAAEGFGGMEFPKGLGNVKNGATFRLMDEQGSVELKSDGDGKEVTVRDRDDKITWQGPWDTPQDKAAAPDGIRERIERLNIDTSENGLQLRLQPMPPPENGLRLQLQPMPPPE